MRAATPLLQSRGSPAVSLDYLVGTGEESRGDFKANARRGTEIDGQLPRIGLLDRQVSRAHAFHDLRRVPACSSACVEKIMSISEHAARAGHEVPLAYRRQTLRRRDLAHRGGISEPRL